MVIADAIDGVEDMIEQDRARRETLHLLRASAADALLTGRVRVADYQSHAYLTERFELP